MSTEQTTVPALTATRVAVATVGAVAANAAVYGLAKAAGEPFVIEKGGSPTTVTLAAVLGMTVATLLFGFAAAAVAQRAWRPAFRAAAAIGAALTVLSLVMLPSAEGPGATKLWLTTLHLVVGSAYVAGLRFRAAAPAAVRTADTSISV